MRILIAEPSHSGHRLTWVRLIVEAAADLPVELHLSTSVEATQTEEYRHQIAPLKARIEVQADMSIGGSGAGVLGSALARYDALTSSVSRLRPDHVYVPYADGLAQMAGLRRTAFGRTALDKTFCEGVILRGGFAYPSRDWRRRLQCRLGRWAIEKAPFDVVHTIDPLVWNEWSRRTQIASRLRLLPDPIPIPEPLSREEARDKLGLPAGGRIIACVGAIDLRKGCAALIKTFEHASLQGDDRLLLVGKHAESIKKLLATEYRASLEAGRIISIDRYVAERELEAAVSASDLVAALYQNHVGSASIVLRAAAVGRPVIGTADGWIGYIIPRFGLGATCSGSVLQMAPALERALDETAGYRQPAIARKLARYGSIPNFQAHWIAELRSRLGLESNPHKITWNELEASPL